MLIICVVLFMLVGCEEYYRNDKNSSDNIQRKQSEQILKEATAQTGMPSVKNFRERKLMKQIIEMRDRSDLITYTYTFSEMTGEKKFFAKTIGFGIPFSTQYTSPEKVIGRYDNRITVPQADPNGLFAPSSSDATWIIVIDKDGNGVPVYMEPKIIVSPFKMH